MEPEAQTVAQRKGSPWSKLAIATTLVLAAVSAVGLVGFAASGGLDPEAEGRRTQAQVVFGDLLIVSWLLCLLVAVAMWIWGWRAGRQGNARAGKIALGYVCAAFLVVLFATYGEERQRDPGGVRDDKPPWIFQSV